MMRPVMLKANKSPNELLALTNCAIFNPGDLPEAAKYVCIKGRTFTAKYALGRRWSLMCRADECVCANRRDPSMAAGQVGFSMMHRRWAEISLGEDIEVTQWDPARERDPNVYVGKLTVEVDFVMKNRQVPDAFDTDLMADHFKSVRSAQRFLPTFPADSAGRRTICIKRSRSIS